jgi:hypothetical protein
MNAIDSIIKRVKFRLSVRQISIIFTLIALILWSFAITQASFNIGEYGLIQGFPAIYFVALALLTIASSIIWFSKENHSVLIVIQLFFLVASLWLAPLMVGGVQRYFALAFGHLGWTEYIIRTGSINPELLWYHSWPGNFILQAAALLVTGSNIDNFENFLPWLPIIWQFLLFFPVYIFFKNTLGKHHPNYCWAGMWIFYLGNYVGLQNNGPQPFGVFCAFTILAFFSNSDIWKSKVIDFRYRFSTIVIFVAVAVVHMLGSFITIAISAGLYLSKRISSFYPILVGILFIIIWSMYGATNFFNQSLTSKILNALRLDTAFQQGTNTFFGGSELYATVNTIKIIFSLILIGISFLGGFLAYRIKTNEYDDFTALSAASGGAVVAIFVGAGYHEELFTRFFLYFLPFLAYFGTKLLSYKPTAVFLVIILMIGLPLSFISQHGGQIADNIPAGYLSASRIFTDHTDSGWVDSAGPVGQNKNRENYHFRSVPYEQIAWDGQLLTKKYLLHSIEDNPPNYITLSEFDQAVESYYGNKQDIINNTRVSLDVTIDCNLVFASKDMILYVDEIHP